MLSSGFHEVIWNSIEKTMRNDLVLFMRCNIGCLILDYSRHQFDYGDNPSRGKAPRPIKHLKRPNNRCAGVTCNVRQMNISRLQACCQPQPIQGSRAPYTGAALSTARCW